MSVADRNVMAMQTITDVIGCSMTRPIGFTRNECNGVNRGTDSNVVFHCSAFLSSVKDHVATLQLIPRFSP